MSEDRIHKAKVRIHPCVDDPDAFLVMTDTAEPGSITVIPTDIAENYWAHPSRYGVMAS